MSSRVVLAEFLLERFSAGELKIFIGALRGGEAVLQRLPLQGTPESFASEAARVLLASGAVNPAFFDALCKRFPLLTQEITQLREALAKHLPVLRSDHADTLDAHLAALRAERSQILKRGGSIAEIDEEILEARRSQRAGAQLREGDVLSGRYELLDRAGKGGFATVWRAYDRDEECIVAVKVLHGHLGEERSRRERFFSGARQMAKLNHPGVVRVLQRKGRDGPHHYFVMEFLPDGDLHRAVLEGRLDAMEGLAAVLRVGEALQAAHAADMVHRDIKPTNILLDADGWPKLTDFDLVRAGDTTLGTRTHVGMGSMCYAAPEAMYAAQRADERSDVYSLAMCALFCLRGEPIRPDVLWNTEQYIVGLGCSDGIKAVLRKALSKQSTQRHESITVLCAALHKPEFGEIPLPDPLPPSAGQCVRVVLGSLPAFKVAWIPSGIFVMGSPEGEKGREDREGPQHEVSLSGFWMGVVPVTQELWRVVMGDNPARFIGSDQRPVEQISWFDAVRFCNALSEFAKRTPVYRFGRRMTGQGAVNIEVAWDREANGFRLPSEAEWEYACRAGTTTRYWAGNHESDLEQGGWHGRNAGGTTHPVALKRANPWGVCDVHGNVSEWCWDRFGAYDFKRRQDPAGPSIGRLRVIRGGSFGSTANRARAAFRGFLAPGNCDHDIGFRLVLSGSDRPPIRDDLAPSSRTPR